MEIFQLWSCIASMGLVGKGDIKVWFDVWRVTILWGLKIPCCARVAIWGEWGVRRKMWVLMDLFEVGWWFAWLRVLFGRGRCFVPWVNLFVWEGGVCLSIFWASNVVLWEEKMDYVIIQEVIASWCRRIQVRKGKHIFFKKDDAHLWGNFSMWHYEILALGIEPYNFFRDKKYWIICYMRVSRLNHAQ